MGLRPLTLFSLKHIAHIKRAAGNPLWEMRGFHFAYPKSGRESLCVEKAVLAPGSVTAVIGHNGAGKTTFFRCLCGLQKRCRGSLYRDGEQYNQKQRMKLCYIVMQDVNHQLFTESVSEEVLISMPKDAMDLGGSSRVDAILEEMDLLDLKDCHPMGLSGGQKQRVAIASAIASERPVILFDEPTSGLDLSHMRQVADAMNRLAESGKTVVVVTHDPEFIVRCCDQVIHIENGYVIEDYSLESSADKEHLLRFFLEDNKEVQMQ